MTFQQYPGPQDAKLLTMAVIISFLLMAMSCGQPTVDQQPVQGDMVRTDTLPVDNTRVRPDTLRLQ